MRGTPTDFSRLLARSWVVPAPFQAGIFLFGRSFSCQKASEIKGLTRLEGGSVLAMMIFASRVFVHPRGAIN
jgi:hypothetical protein